MIDKLELKNFRCFEDTTFEGLRPVTLIAGSNNIGKSTLLDALFLFIDRNSPDVFAKLNGFRGLKSMVVSPGGLWEHLFYNFNIKNDIILSVRDRGIKQTAYFAKDASFSMPVPTPPGQSGHNSLLADSYPLKMTYSRLNSVVRNHFILTNMGIFIHTEKNMIDEGAPPAPRIQYMGPNTTIDSIELAELFSNVETNGKTGECLKALKILEPRINDLSVSIINGLSGISADIGLKKRISINMLGEGTNKLLRIICFMLSNPDSILLLDEIENGFHYSLFPKIWDIISHLTGMTGCQAFATTHSYECLTGAAGLASDDRGGEIFRFIRMEKRDNLIIPVSFENDSFDYAVRNDWEIR